jgi:hypothetical protein
MFDLLGESDRVGIIRNHYAYARRVVDSEPIILASYDPSIRQRIEHRPWPE